MNVLPRIFASLLLCLPLVLLSACINISPSVFGTGSQQLKEVELGGQGEHKVLMIVVEGSITSFDSRSILGGSPNTVDDVRRQLDRARRDNDISAVILRVNSPGGGATASDTIFHEIERFKEDTGIPVVAFFQDVAASGGYYISMAADRIVAQPTTITGSIGVISSFVTVTGLMEKIGVKAEIFRSGDMKGTGLPLRDFTDDERVLAQEMTMQFYDVFISRVVAGRPNLSEERIRELADGRVYMAPLALEHGLIDQIGYFEDAFQTALEVADIDSAKLVNYSVVSSDANRSIYTRPRTDASMDGSFKLADSMGMLRSGASFYYLWGE